MADDNEAARVFLAYLLRKIEGVEVVAEAANGLQAVELVKILKPKVVFLDQEMPGMNGIMAAKEILALEGQVPLIVFATGHEGYAIHAFAVQAVDYLVKPFTEERVRESIDRVRQWLEKDGEKDSYEPMNRLPIKEGKRTLFVNLEDILAIETQQGRTLIYAKGKQYKTGYSMRELEERLNPQVFLRVHNSFLVNKEKIIEVEQWGDGSLYLKLEDLNIDIPVSRSRAKEVKKRLGI